MTKLPTRHKPLIAVIEDDASVRQITTHMLEYGGFAVIEAGDGAEGLQLIAAAHSDLAMVLADVNMPHVDGVTLASHVTSHYPTLPVLLMTACPHEARGKVRDVRIDVEVLDKPFLMGSLLAAVRRTLRSGEPMSRSAAA